MIVKEIDSSILSFLKKRNILKPYIKAKQYLLNDELGLVSFRKRKRKSEDINYFQITRKYRAIGYFERNEFLVTYICAHQE